MVGIVATCKLQQLLRDNYTRSNIETYKREKPGLTMPAIENCHICTAKDETWRYLFQCGHNDALAI
eukprot:319085-Ditylum_brightwellii.AAC.1